MQAEEQLHSELADASAIEQILVQLVRDASVELNVTDLKDLEASRALLGQGRRIYISHLPKQHWDETLLACRLVSAAGFAPIPHIPVRLIEDEATLDGLLERASSDGVEELLLIAGDYAQAAGPYSSVAEVLRTGKLRRYGFKRISIAGHPEGHPRVPLAEIRRAEIEKAHLAAPLEVTFVTQFFFEATPFLGWASHLRRHGVSDARLFAGLAGPAGIATLLRFARRCGVGPSIRALAARPGALARLIVEHGPDDVMRDLAVARAGDASVISGLHFFCFGGYLRTCEWLSRYAP